MKKYKISELLLTIIGIIIIVGNIIEILTGFVDPTTMAYICIAEVTLVMIYLYAKYYGEEHYGEHFKRDFSDVDYNQKSCCASTTDKKEEK